MSAQKTVQLLLGLHLAARECMDTGLTPTWPKVLSLASQFTASLDVVRADFEAIADRTVREVVEG
jgi:hypothetical protein